MSVNQPKKDTKQSIGYAFKQQVMKAWQPVPTLNSTIILFLILSIFFLVMGIVLIYFTGTVNEHYLRYDVECQGVSTCQINFALDESFQQPVFLYYELQNFYQNHRRYVKSKSTSQLGGQYLSASALSTDCDPATTNAQLNKTVSIGYRQADGTYNGSVLLNPTDPAIPCGLIAKSLFNGTSLKYFIDSFSVYNRVDTNFSSPITIKVTNIAWPSDLNGRYKNTPNWQTQQWLDMEVNEHFMVWMRTAALPTFRKLWGRIETNLPAGKYTYQISNNFDVSQFNGQKSLVLSTANAFGGRNTFLSIAYLTVGVICSLITIGFLVRKLLSNSDNKNK